MEQAVLVPLRKFAASFFKIGLTLISGGLTAMPLYAIASYRARDGKGKQYRHDLLRNGQVIYYLHSIYPRPPQRLVRMLQQCLARAARESESPLKLTRSRVAHY
jgi:hypothetical protein